MIKIELMCRKEHTAEGWFPSEDDYTRQLQQGLITCPECHNIMQSKQDIDQAEIRKQRAKDNSPVSHSMMLLSQGLELLDMVGNYVSNTYEDVGSEFFNEAIRASEGERDLMFVGSPTDEEVDLLLDAGIDLFHVPNKANIDDDNY